MTYVQMEEEENKTKEEEKKNVKLVHDNNSIQSVCLLSNSEVRHAVRVIRRDDETNRSA